MSGGAPPAIRTGTEIAIVGMSGRFPGAPDLDTFWSNLRDGVESVRFFSEAELLLAGIPADRIRDARYVPAQAVLDDVAGFDDGFFGLTPRDARLLDPQQRLLLECAWEALEQAGYATGSGHTVGVYVGVGFPRYLVANVMAAGVLGPDEQRHAAIWNDKDHAATRVAYHLGLRGPGVTVQSACSSSLVAVHQAAQALLGGECDVALAGGMAVRLPPVGGYRHVDGGVESADGHCRAFDARASGFVPGSGGGVVALRRLADALADGDTVHAVILGSAVNNDGADKVGYTAPSVTGQMRVIQTAHLVAGVEPADISYVEAHGTGTRLGDPVEVAALNAVFGPGNGWSAPCALGSVKTNIGHLDVGAGVAGLIKTALALRHEQIPASLNFAEPNADIDFTAGPFAVATGTLEWRRGERPRRAGVSSFGIGGTNAHVVLEEAPPAGPGSPEPDEPQVLLVSARTAEALDAATAALAGHLAGGPAPLGDVAYTTQVGRRAFGYRRAAVAGTAQEAAAALRGAGRHAPAPATVPVAFLFPGQGAPRPGVGAALYGGETVFRAELDRCTELLRASVGDIRDLLLPGPGGPAEHRLRRTAEAQPVLFALGYAMARQWQAWGVRPDAVLGHSLGEYVAACLAGVFTLEDALTVVVRRAELMQRMPPGAMLAVAAPAADLAGDLSGAGLSLAAVNGPAQCVVSGPEPAVAELAAGLADRRVASRRLPGGWAFHSTMMAPVAPGLRAVLSTVEMRPPSLRVASTVTGAWLTDAEAVDPEYWIRHLLGTVRFADAVAALDDGTVCVELGTGGTLAPLVRRIRPGAVALAPLDGPGEDARRVRAALGRVWCVGVPVDWAALHAGRARRRVPLPTYPFQRRQHWIEPAPPASPPAGDRTHPAGGLLKRDDPGSWTYLPHWRPAAPVGVPARAGTETWLIVAADGALPEPVLAGLARHAPVLAHLRPGEDYTAALARLPARPSRVLYRCPDAPVSPDGLAPDGLAPDRLAPATEAPFVDLMRLVQELVADPGPRRIAVLTAGAQPVVPGDPVNLAHAGVLGLVPVLPQECPHVACHGVDLDTEPSPSDVDALVAELNQAGPPEPFVALRRGIRWLPDLAPADLTGVAGGVPLREGGRYLITGGLGSLGLLIARHLARTYRARLVLTTRRALGDSAGEAAQAPADAVLDGVLDADRPAPPRPPRAVAAGRLTDELSVRYVARLFATAGVDTAPGATTTERELMQRLDTVPAYRRFVGAMVTMLAEDGVVERDRERIVFRRDPGDPDAMDARVRAEYPEFTPVLDLLRTCVEATPEVLAGRRHAVGVLFPDGRSETFDRVNRLIGEHSDQVHYLGVLRDIVRDLVGRVGRPVRVLEVGAGKGRLTELLTEALEPLSVEYHITDISSGFVMALRARLGGTAGTSFGALDISRDPVSQGLPAEGFDLVVGFNVVHAAPHTGRAAANLLRLLRPGGVLCLAEAVADERFGRLIWGLTKEWWSFTDTDVRTHSPLMPIAGWLRVLADAGYATVRALPADPRRREACDTALLFAQRPAGSRTAPTGAIDALVADGADVLVRSVDVTDQAAMRALLAEADERFGGIDGVLHLAYVAGGSLVALRTAEEVAAEFAPKVAGTLVLDELFRHRRLDFMMLFSSLNTLLGGFGAAAYAGAGAFLERFAHTVHGRRPYPVTAVNWPLWHGQDTPSATELRRRMLPPGVDDVAMEAAEGLGVFERILAARPGPQVVVSPGDVAALLAFARRWAAGPPRPATGPAGTPPATSDAERVGAVWRDVLGVDDVPPDADFASLGGDSLTASQIVARLRDEFGLDLALRDFLAEPTIVGTVRALRGARPRTPAGPPPAPEPSAGPATAPLSPLQRRMWFTDRLTPGNPAFHVRSAVRLSGPLDVELLTRVLAEVERRHDALRTRIATEGGTPVQVVEAGTALVLRRADAREDSLAAAIEAELRAPFDLTERPLWRAALFALAPTEHVLVLTLQHIIADGRSAGVLERDITALYAAWRADPSTPVDRVLPPLRLTHADFARSQLDSTGDDETRRQLAYWRRQLAGAPAEPGLAPPATRLGHDGDRYRFDCATDLVAAVRNRARASRCTTFMVFVAAYQILLAAHGGQRDIVVGTAASTRTRAELEPMVGFLVNTLALRTDLRGDPDLGQVLGRTRRTCLDAYAHQDVPFDSVVEALDIAPGTRFPLFEAVIGWQWAGSPPTRVADLRLRREEVDSRTAQYPLALDVTESAVNLAVTWEVNRDAFGPADVAGLHEDLLDVLAALAADPSARVEALCAAIRSRAEERARQRSAALRQTNSEKLRRRATVRHALPEAGRRHP
jgi:acyl transferase domain-containing protein/SAM-dependent methyltransferase/acyl carrier protein